MWAGFSPSLRMVRCPAKTVQRDPLRLYSTGDVGATSVTMYTDNVTASQAAPTEHNLMVNRDGFVTWRYVHLRICTRRQPRGITRSDPLHSLAADHRKLAILLIVCIKLVIETTCK